MLKKLSKLLVALVLLLALYTGTYFFLYHTAPGTRLRLHSNDPDPFADPTWPRLIQTVFSPAIYAEIELVHFPKFRRYATDRWHPIEPPADGGTTADFIDIGSDLECTFTLGAFSGSGRLEFDENHQRFFLVFHSGGEPHELDLRLHTYSPSVVPKKASVRIRRIDAGNPGPDPFADYAYAAEVTTTPPAK